MILYEMSRFQPIYHNIVTPHTLPLPPCRVETWRQHTLQWKRIFVKTYNPGTTSFLPGSNRTGSTGVAHLTEGMARGERRHQAARRQLLGQADARRQRRMRGGHFRWESDAAGERARWRHSAGQWCGGGSEWWSIDYWGGGCATCERTVGSMDWFFELLILLQACIRYDVLLIMYT